MEDHTPYQSVVNDDDDCGMTIDSGDTGEDNDDDGMTLKYMGMVTQHKQM